MMIRSLYILGFILISGIITVHAQIPRFAPNPANSKPVEWSNPADLIIYFILPIVFIIFGFISWNNRKKRNA